MVQALDIFWKCEITYSDTVVLAHTVVWDPLDIFRKIEITSSDPAGGLVVLFFSSFSNVRGDILGERKCTQYRGTLHCWYAVPTMHCEYRGTGTLCTVGIAVLYARHNE